MFILTTDTKRMSSKDWYKEGKIAEHNKSYIKAIHVYKMSIESNSTRTDALYRLAKVYYTIKEYHDCMLCIQKLLEIRPDLEKNIKRDMSWVYERMNR